MPLTESQHLLGPRSKSPLLRTFQSEYSIDESDAGRQRETGDDILTRVDQDTRLVSNTRVLGMQCRASTRNPVCPNDLLEYCA